MVGRFSRSWVGSSYFGLRFFRRFCGDRCRGVCWVLGYVVGKSRLLFVGIFRRLVL